MIQLVVVVVVITELQSKVTAFTKRQLADELLAAEMSILSVRRGLLDTCRPYAYGRQAGLPDVCIQNLVGFATIYRDN